VSHDGYLAADVLDVDGSPELPLGYAFAREQLARVAVDAEVSHAELPAAELAVDEVAVLDVLLGHTGEYRDRRLLFDSFSAGTTLAMVVCVGEARFDVLAGHGGRGSAAVSHGRRSGDRGGGEGLGGDGRRGVLAFHIIMRKP